MIFFNCLVGTVYCGGLCPPPPNLIDLLKFNRGFHLERLQLLPPPHITYLTLPQGAFVPPKYCSDTNVLSRGTQGSGNFQYDAIAEGFSAFPLNGGETFGMWEQ